MHKNRQEREGTGEGTGQPAKENRHRCEWLPSWEELSSNEVVLRKEVSSLVGARGSFLPWRLTTCPTTARAFLWPLNSKPHIQLSAAADPSLLVLFRPPCTFQNQPKPTALHKRWGLLILLLQTPSRGIWRNMKTAGSLQVQDQGPRRLCPWLSVCKSKRPVPERMAVG